MVESKTGNGDKTDLFNKALAILSTHYVMAVSFVAFMFSAICFVWTTKYFSMWGIEFFDYASISDMYPVAFKLGIVFGLTMVFIAVCFIIFIVAIITFIWNKFIKSLIPNVIAYTLLFASLIFSIHSLSESNPYEPKMFFDHKKTLNEGARVNIKLRWNDLKSVDCVAVIGGTEDYLFVWDYKESSPIILSRASVVMVSVAVPKMPDFVNEVIVNEKIDTASFKTSAKELSVPLSKNGSTKSQQKYDEWVYDLKSICEQVIQT